MNYYAESVFEYIRDKAERLRKTSGIQSRTMVMVASLPATVILEICLLYTSDAADE